MIAMHSPYMTLAEAAEYARISERTLARWLVAGLPNLRAGRRRLVERVALDAWLRQGVPAAPAAA